MNMNINTPSSYKKGDVVLFEWTSHIVMAVLSWPREETTYSVCTIELLLPRFWIKIEEDSLIPYQSLSEKIKRRVRGFL